MTFLKKWIATMTLCTALSASAAPMFNLFELGIQPGQTERYNEIGHNNITTSLNEEPGTLVMYSLKSADNPDMAYMLELYADQTAYQTHLQSPQYQAFLQAAPTILTEHKKRIALDPQFLADKKIEQTANTQNHFQVLEIKPEFNADFHRLLISAMAEALTAENGVLAMYAATEQEQPNRWYLYQVYADEQAYQQHQQTPHFQAYLAQSAQMVQDQRIIAVTPELLRNQGGLNFRLG
ncbi:putative quinol monooxygenase [Testudinibacter sp. P27/CKL/0425]